MQCNFVAHYLVLRAVNNPSVVFIGVPRVVVFRSVQVHGFPMAS